MKIEAGGIYKDGYGEIISIIKANNGLFLNKHKPECIYTSDGVKVGYTINNKYNLIECIQQPQARYTREELIEFMTTYHINGNSRTPYTIKEVQKDLPNLYKKEVERTKEYLDKFYPTI